eukprot:scaffold22822_cov30-Tisochrysis_lutea.AAC.1
MAKHPCSGPSSRDVLDGRRLRRVRSVLRPAPSGLARGIAGGGVLSLERRVLAQLLLIELAKGCYTHHLTARGRVLSNRDTLHAPVGLTGLHGPSEYLPRVLSGRGPRAAAHQSVSVKSAFSNVVPDRTALLKIAPCDRGV